MGEIFDGDAATPALIDKDLRAWLHCYTRADGCAPRNISGDETGDHWTLDVSTG